MDVRRIDPRDTAFVEDHRAYRVYFSDRQPDAPETDAEHTDEGEISDADLAQVLDWTGENTHGRACSLYTCSERGQEHVLRHLMPKDLYGRSTSAKVNP